MVPTPVQTAPAPPFQSSPGPARAHALVVLGCAPGRDGTFAGALGRRVRRAAAEWERARDGAREEERPQIIIVSGGRAWGGAVEADVMEEGLVAEGVPRALVVRERASLDTRDNARFSAALCSRRGIARVAIVTCDWHLARARLHFEAAGLEVVKEVPAGEGEAMKGWRVRGWTLAKERFLRALAKR